MYHPLSQDGDRIMNMDAQGNYIGDSYPTYSPVQVLEGWGNNAPFPYIGFPQCSYGYEPGWPVVSTIDTTPPQSDYHVSLRMLAHPQADDMELAPSPSSLSQEHLSTEEHSVPTSNSMAPTPVPTGILEDRQLKHKCRTCSRWYARHVRAEACSNRHSQEKPHVCTGACGDLTCTAAYRSLEHLRRHQRSPDKRKISCPKCHKHILKQNIARHRDRCP